LAFPSGDGDAVQVAPLDGSRRLAGTVFEGGLNALASSEC